VKNNTKQEIETQTHGIGRPRKEAIRLSTGCGVGLVGEPAWIPLFNMLGRSPLKRYALTEGQPRISALDS
jgi:hypothetical protein